MADNFKHAREFAEASCSDDHRLCFVPPDLLEVVGSASRIDGVDYVARDDDSYLKTTAIDLGEAQLTDRQMLAVSMVFYGGIKKTRAARAMGISTQALSEHLTAALKKIKKTLF